MPDCNPSQLVHGHSNPSTAAAARRFEVAAVYVLRIITIQSWVPGVLESKSLGTHLRLGTRVSDDALAAPCLFLWCC